MITTTRLTGDYPDRWAAENAAVLADPDAPSVVVCLHQNTAVMQARDAFGGPIVSSKGRPVMVPDPIPLYSLALILADGPRVDESTALAREFARTTTDRCPLHTRDPQVWMVGPGERGEFNLRGYASPAVVWEPGHITHPEYSAWAKSDGGQVALAGILVDTARKALPRGGRLFGSIGHVGKTSRPDDRGAEAHGGGWESDICEAVWGLVVSELSK